jgi:spore coat polysaccharide biosynthesis protein SpsF (cytidylyltransferase family)
MTFLKYFYNRARKSKKINRIIIATTSNKKDNIIEDICIQNNWYYYRGSELDVLDRFYQAVKNDKPDWIVRLTSDCPLIDPKLVDDVIAFTIKNNKDYVTNTFIENFPDGQDIEVFKYAALKKAWENAILNSEREHVTPYIRKNSDFNGGNLFTALNYDCQSDFSKIRMTVDEIRDFELIALLVNDLGTEKSWEEYTNYIIRKELFKMNSEIIRNEGLLKSLKNDL